MHDFEQISISKTNPSGSKNIHIKIPPKGTGKVKSSDNQLGSLGLSHFVHLHITVESQDHAQQASYTITYSSGDTVVYLQDGLIMEYNLVGKK